MGLADSITAVVLAGGLGTRLRCLVPGRPKVMAQVRGRPFLEYLLEQLRENGFRRVVICSGYRGEQIEQGLGAAYGPLAIVYSREDRPLGTGGALRLALSHIKSEVAFVMNGDSFCDVTFAPFLRWFEQTRPEAALLLVETSDTSRYGRVVLGPGGRIVAFEEKGSRAGEGWISAGVYLFRRYLIAALPSGVCCSLEYQVFPSLVGKALYGFPEHGAFLDIGTPTSFRRAAHFFATRPGRNATSVES